MKVKTEENLKELEAELEERVFVLIERLMDTPFFMFKARVKLKGQIENTKSIIKLVRMYVKAQSL